MELSFEELRVLAHRCRLALTEEEMKKYSRDLVALEELSLALLPYSDLSACGVSKPQRLADMRSDTVCEPLPQRALLDLAPVSEGDYFSVPLAIKE